MKVNTNQFGVIIISAEEIITFPEGLLGFRDNKQYILLEYGEDIAPFKWLQSVDEGWLGFVVIEPLFLVDEYDIEISAECASELKLVSPSDADIYAIVTVAEPPKNSTANLQAPIIVNPAFQIAKQVILTDSPYHIRHPILELTESVQ